MMTAGKLSEFLKANLGGAAVWLSMQNYDQATALAAVDGATEGDTFEVQWRRATDAAGSNPADLGDPVTVTATADGDLVGLSTIYASDLGRTAGGVDYTHVAVVITGGGSPAVTTTAAFVLRSHGRYGNSQD